MKQTKADFVRKELYYWCKRLRIKQIKLKQDQRYTGHLIFEDEDYVLIYNVHYLRKWSEALIMSGIFHEIGHIKHMMPYDTKEQQIESEYRAEKYSLKMLRRFKPHMVPEVVAWTKRKLTNPKYRKQFPPQYYAFKQIKEYGGDR